MKKKNIIISSILSACLIVISTFIVNINADMFEEVDKALIKNNISVNLYSEFYNKLKSHENYEDCYGGAYIDESGNLNLLSVNNDKDHLVNSVLKELDNSEIVTSTLSENNLLSLNIEKISEDILQVKSVKYSFKDLVDLQESLDKYFTEFKITKTELRQRENKVKIYILDEKFRPEIISFLRHENPGFDEDILEFEKEIQEITPQLTAYNGTKISNGSTYGTIGFNAKYNGKWGGCD